LSPLVSRLTSFIQHIFEINNLYCNSSMILTLLSSQNTEVFTLKPAVENTSNDHLQTIAVLVEKNLLGMYSSELMETLTHANKQSSVSSPIPSFSYMPPSRHPDLPYS